tara:strand:+ start:1488 stop:3923 length:2436 start_codon:yes stop_codon:yes gene_type:complete
MSTTRNNHYVPEWFQKGFWEPGQSTLAYLNLSPDAFTRSDGSTGYVRALHHAPPSRAFVQRDLYSTFFGTAVNDEIERKLFGDVDARGAIAVKAYASGDELDCHHNFENLFEYLDIQKLRTPKGLAWLKAQYPRLSQNELMMEMQAMRMMHCTIWSEGVREIVSANNSDIKFILSDHPVTVFNRGAPPGSKLSAYPSEPGIELKGTQTLIPLDRDHCLILTNLEYAQDPSVDPLQKRTFARRFRSSMVRTDAFIRTRSLDAVEVGQINQIIRSRASRYVAAGNSAWLPEPVSHANAWESLSSVLLPPEDQLWGYGGEMFASYDDGRVIYQDAYGRTEKPRDFLQKTPPKRTLKPGAACGCGSERRYDECCKPLPVHLRPTWSELSIRERNLELFRGIEDILELKPDSDWVDVRRSITDEKISHVYRVHDAFWPLETDLLSLLPKPDGRPRAVYTGLLHPEKIHETAIGLPLLFGEVLVQHPFVIGRAMRDEFNPVKTPSAYRQEFLKSVLLFMQLMPLVESGQINLYPDPWEFDYHLRAQTMHMAEERAAYIRPMMQNDNHGMKALAQEEYRRSLYLLSDKDQRALIKRNSPDLNAEQVEQVVQHMRQLQEADPLGVLQDGAELGSENGAQLSTFKLAPNFEMAMYIAQATGASIVTDHPARWQEILFTILMRGEHPDHHLPSLAHAIQCTDFSIPQHYADVFEYWASRHDRPHAAVFRDAFRYLGRIGNNGVKPNFEKSLRSRFERGHKNYQDYIDKADLIHTKVRIQTAFPENGIYESTITRLLLMSSSEHHLPSVPMAFYVKPQTPQR